MTAVGMPWRVHGSLGGTLYTKGMETSDGSSALTMGAPGAR